MTKKETLKRALKELVEARHNLRNGLKNGVPPAQESALWEKVEYRELVVEELRHPSHIDREAWEPCGACKDGKITIHVPEFRAMAVCNQHMDHEAFDLTLRLNFCPLCGRPMTEEAWAMLEKQLRGD